MESFLTFLMEQDPSHEGMLHAFQDKIREFQSKYQKDLTLKSIADPSELEYDQADYWQRYCNFRNNLKTLLEQLKQGPREEEMDEIKKKHADLVNESKQKVIDPNVSKSHFYAWMNNRNALHVMYLTFFENGTASISDIDLYRDVLKNEMDQYS